MEITQKKGNNKGAFLAKDEDNNIVGEMTYVWSSDSNFIIDHTAVSAEYRGQGVGKEMVEKAVEFARQNNYTILPLCSFVRSVFARNPSYEDVVQI